MRGEISLGVGDKLYLGLWVANSRSIVYTFSEELPAPYNSNIVQIPTPKKLTRAFVYEEGGKMVNSILEAGKQN